MSRIVVGIDGSEHARRALGWAVDEARLRGADLVLVHALPHREMMLYPAVRVRASDEELQSGAQQVIDEALASVDTDGLEVERLVDASNPAKLLCEAAESAEMVVVGARGLGGFRGLLMGSVSQQVALHATTPVLVVGPASP